MGKVKMRNILILSIVCLAGCQNVYGPFSPRDPQRVDERRFSIIEQESRGRDRYAIPDESPTLPPSGFGIPGTGSRGDR
jgi:hypothetical protein